MRRIGFTLIELLVVIGLIALLAAISTPALHKCRQHTRAVVCASNISRLSKALFAYEITNGSFPYGFDDTEVNPPPGGYPGNAPRDRVGRWWFNYIIDYNRIDRGKNTAALCPAKRLAEPGLNRSILAANYGINISICKSQSDFTSHSQTGFVGEPLGLADIKHTGETILLCDSGYAVITWMHAADVPPVALGSRIEDMAYIPGLEINKQRLEESTIWPGLENDAIFGRHPGRSINVSYLDGSVSRIKAEKVFVEEDNGSYKNRSPLWVPK